MRTKIQWLGMVAMLLCLLMMTPQRMQANDYLEKSEHYKAYASGADKIHFKIPLYSESEAGFSYFVKTDDETYYSFLFYDTDDQDGVGIAYISSENKDEDESDSYSCGSAKIKMIPGRGLIEVTNICNGGNKVVPNDGAWHSYTVKKNEESENGNDYVTWLEFDWYPPEALADQKIDVGVLVNIFSHYKPTKCDYIYEWRIAYDLSGGNNIMMPELYDPYFYAMDDQGAPGFGCAAVQYMTFYDPKSYLTSFETGPAHRTDKRSDKIIVPTTDSIQTGFYATFDVYMKTSPDTVMSTQKSSTVSIPPYHRIYDLAATEETDETGTYTGNNVLEWHIKNPQLVDLVDGDYFEVQRALEPDFSDAKQLAVIPMRHTEQSAVYTYVDKSRDTWTGNAQSEFQTIFSGSMQHTQQFTMPDENGDPMYELTVNLKATNFSVPAVPVYYRVRRASSSIWGWVADFSQQTAMEKHNYLAPLDAVQADYTLDPEYETNRKVHFQIHLKNDEVHMQAPPLDECEYSYTVDRGYKDTVELEIDDRCTYPANTMYYYRIQVVDNRGNVLKDWNDKSKTHFRVAPGAKVKFQCGNYNMSILKYERIDTSWDVIQDSKFSISDYQRSTRNYTYAFTASSAVEAYVKSRLEEMRQAMQENFTSGLGRCMWDRTAKLLLLRTMEETGAVNEMIIPQDSIVRLADGSWMAYFTDVANVACAHMTYSARIDQSGSDLRVADPYFLNPVAIHGPSLYYDEAATITSFTATQGAAAGQQKRGVTLNWTPSSVAVDEYTLMRIAKGSDAAPDTLYTGLDNSFFDETAVPEVRYDYVITAHYNCNGKSTDNSATAEGWRSPYGEISGAVLMPDNSGMAGVTVALQGPDGTTVKSVVTGSDGTFLFDSLLYTIGGTTQFAVVPTHAYAVFSYNYTSAQSASVTLSADHAVASAIDFANTSTARLTGRALYKFSTIPVVGAMFTLNGDTVLRNNAPLKTGTDGNFELTVTKSQPYVLRIFKPGHVFEGEGILHVEADKDTFAITKPLDGVRYYDLTKVRLVGRVAGGIDQRDLPEAFGLGTNNLGEDLQLVLQLEGDNIAHFVHDPDDLSRDTILQTVNHEVWKSGQSTPEIVGQTNTLLEKKRIVIHPDPETGEYEVELFPVKYKVVQASAKGYATLFASGQGGETFDLTNAPLTVITDSLTTNDQRLTTTYNAVYDRIYRTPVKVQLKQLMYGLEQDGYGEPTMSVDDFNPGEKSKIALFTRQPDGTVTYTMGYPLFYYNRKYQFEAQAYEDYYYNNDATQHLDRVPLRGGNVTVHNGMHNGTDHMTYELNQQGKNRNVWLTVDHMLTQNYGEQALATVSLALEQEGNTVETDAFRAFVIGDLVQGKELTATDADISLLDIIRDPGGAGSSAWVESGTTYNYSYTESYNWKAGLKLTPKWGLSVTSDVGIVTAPMGNGNYTGSTFNSSKQFSFTVPIVHEWAWGYKYSYQFTTNETISTSSKKNIKSYIGSNADVFVGVTISQLAGKAKSVTVIDDTLFQARRPAIEAGTMHVLASGIAEDGKPYHLVTGEKVVMGSAVNHTFAYSQYYILENIIPKLAMQRQNLLMCFPDSAAARARADALDEPVYWYIDSTAAAHLKDTLARSTYRVILPTGSKKAYADKVAAINNMLLKWMTIVIQNEKEKIVARQSGQLVGSYSVSSGNSLSHTDSYNATANYNELPQGAGLIGTEAGTAGAAAAKTVASSLQNLSDFFGNSAETFGLATSEALKNFFYDNEKTEQKNLMDIGTVTNTSKFTMGYEPVLSFDSDSRMSSDKTVKKSCGFSLVPDDQGDITVSVYRAPMDSLWINQTQDIRENVDHQNDNDILYGSYVFFTEAGATYCNHEKEERTQFYNKGTVINNGTMAIAVPEISIDRYEISNVPADQRAVFHLELRNAGEVQYGFPSMGTTMSLYLGAESNHHGAKVYVNGAPLVQAQGFYLSPGQSTTQVMEVERGEVDDYEDLSIYLGTADCGKNFMALKFSVHFMPESSPVTIASPRQNWVMNTLSQHDSVGYYLPVDIDGFNIHHKNFDHIEFQYKLSKESDEMWVTAMSFYAEDSLYNLATGNKAMIENGRIPPFRFYGERDPMEQEYDLRAVSFCRYGSGFVTKASPVISGVKDTRPPVLFGEPQPANAILGIGDDLKLRFSEPIAGNYLDEDNNFQLRGVTNETGITAGTSIHFDGTPDSYARTKINRSLAGKSFSLDMLVRPTEPYRTEHFFTYELAEDITFVFGKTADNRLFAQVGEERVTSAPLVSPMLEFTRVILTYDHDTGIIRFFAGTTELTDNQSSIAQPIVQSIVQSSIVQSSPLTFGSNFAGDMLETRLWTKALSPDEISATNGHYLTGYERELLAYYRMNEGKGEIMSDKANGATLYLHNAVWKLQKGISLALNNEPVELASDLLSRSENYDETLMFWFKTDPQSSGSESSISVFRAGWKTNDSLTTGTLLAIEDGDLVLHSGDNQWTVANSPSVTDGEWHHFVLAISRTYNTAAIYLDGNLTQTAAATKFGPVSGVMYLGGEGFVGNIDEFVIFEQMLPSSLIQEYYYASPVGDEMGLMAYLPFEEQRLNPNGVLEQVFSVNDRRQFKDRTTGEIIDRIVPLIPVTNNQSPITNLADKANFAPVRTNSLLSKLNFGWTFNQEELLINLKMQDVEINKQTVYVTVRDVEDLHGNPMPSPVTWLAFVDRSALRWENRASDYLTFLGEYDNTVDNYYFNWIVNTTGKRHQFTVESVPDWLRFEPSYGSIDPLETIEVHIYPNWELPVGTYTDIVYLTDEDGMSEPASIQFTVEGRIPWKESDINRELFPNTMSLRGQVCIENENGVGRFDTDNHDLVAVFCEGQMVGLANNSFNSTTNTSYVYLTIYGNSGMEGKPLAFKLWQASTGKTYNLTPSARQKYQTNAMRGVSPSDPIRLTTAAGEIQQLAFEKGWNWVSWYLRPASAALNNLFAVEQGFSEGDIVKSPTTQSFAEMTLTDDTTAWMGSLTTTNYKNMYMVRTAKAFNTTIEGKPLTDEQRTITLRTGWNSVAYLLSDQMSLKDALADYYDKATIGDIIKSRNQFAVFTENSKWEGSLQSLRPGQGYLLKRLASGSVTMQFVQPASRNMPKKAPLSSDPLSPSSTEPAFTNPHAASNMTMIAKVEGLPDTGYGLLAFIGSDLVGVASPVTRNPSSVAEGEVLYFLTIQSDVTGGTLRFETEDGVILTPSPLEKGRGEASYVPNAHLGSLKSPVILTPSPLGEGLGEVYKLIEDDHVVIIRNGIRYDVTGKKLE